MFSIDLTFVWTAINLLLMYWVVNKFLFKRLGAFMDKRSAGIAADMELGATRAAEGEALIQKHEALLKEAVGQRQSIIDDAKASADKEYARITREAKQEAVRIKDEARKDIEHEREQMVKSLSQETVELAVAAASKVLETSVDSEKNRALIESFLEAQHKGGAA